MRWAPVCTPWQGQLCCTDTGQPQENRESQNATALPSHSRSTYCVQLDGCCFGGVGASSCQVCASGPVSGSPTCAQVSASLPCCGPDKVYTAVLLFLRGERVASGASLPSTHSNVSRGTILAQNLSQQHGSSNRAIVMFLVLSCPLDKNRIT
jgi:hypothetical protein